MTADPAAATDGDQLTFHPSKLRKTRGREWLIRFAFGGGVSAAAGVVAAAVGPVIGGIFLAFPAILLASLTLMAQQEGPRQARDDARGATLGTLGCSPSPCSS